MEQGTKEWLDMRKNHIGASDAPIISVLVVENGHFIRNPQFRESAP